jgi:hypothetical protein
MELTPKGFVGLQCSTFKMLGKVTIEGLGLTNDDLEPCSSWV